MQPDNALTVKSWRHLSKREKEQYGEMVARGRGVISMEMRKVVGNRYTGRRPGAWAAGPLAEEGAFGWDNDGMSIETIYRSVDPRGHQLGGHCQGCAVLDTVRRWWGKALERAAPS